MLAMENDTKTTGKAFTGEVSGRRYELGYLLLPTITEQAIPEILEKIKGSIVRVGGVVSLANPPVSISLAYPMYRNEGGKNTEYTRAYFGFMHFGLESGSLPALKKEIEAETAILRCLFTKDPHEVIRTPEALVGVIDGGESPEEPKALDDVALDKEIADMLVS